MPRSPQHVFVNVDASQTDAQVVPPVPGKQLRVLQVIMVCGADATDVTFNSMGDTSAAISPLFANASNGGAVLPYTPAGWFNTVNGEALTVTTGAGSTVGILIAYEEF